MDLKFKLLLLLAACQLCSGYSYFSLVGPRSIQKGDDYVAYLSYANYFNDETLVVTLEGKNGTEDETEISLKAGQTVYNERVIFSLAEHENLKQNYSLKATVGDFSQQATVFFINKAYSVFIQTDKSVYKPGDIVRSRVLVLDSDTKPYAFKKLHFNVTDQDGNEIVTVLNDQRGSIHEYSIPIVDEPVHGNWTISVKVNPSEDNEDEPTKYTFEVTQYVLPRFEVYLKTTPHIEPRHDVVSVVVSANYTFGEPVKGKATVTANVYDSQNPSLVMHTKIKHVDVDISKTVSFDILNDLQIKQVVRNNIVELKVNFVEDLTGNEREASTNVTVHVPDDYNLKLIRPYATFKPGFPFSIKARVQTYDGTFVANSARPVQVKIKYKYEQLKCDKRVGEFVDFENRYERYLINGYADLSLDVPHNATKMEFELKYEDISTKLTIPPFFSKTLVYMQAAILNRKVPKVGESYNVKVNCNQEMPALSYVVVGRTGKSQSRKTNRKKKVKEDTLSIEVERWMMPKANLLVYYIHNTGDIIYDRIELALTEELPNNVTISFDKKSAKPGQDVKITIKTKPYSIVGVLGIDKSVELFKSGHDLNEERIFTDLRTYNQHEAYGDLDIIGRKSRYQEFGKANAIILTNAQRGYPTACIDARSMLDGKIVPVANYVDKPFNEYDGVLENPDEEEDAVRNNFPETWLFDTKIADNEGEVELTKKVPDTMTSWVVSSFALHKDQGLGIAKPVELRVSKQFFAVLNLPYSIRLHEVLKVPVSIFNYMPVKKGATFEVTMFAVARTHPKTETAPPENPEEEMETVEDEDVPEEDEVSVAAGEQTHFEFVDSKAKSMGNCNSKRLALNETTEKVFVAQNSVGITHFYIRPQLVGEISIRVQVIYRSSRTKSYKDVVERKLLVEREGVMEYRSDPIIIQMKNATDGSKFSKNMKFDIDSDAPPRSIKVKASVIGNIMGSSLTNMDNEAIKSFTPTDQAVSRLMTNAIKMSYLSSVGKLSKAQRNKGALDLATGLQTVKKAQLPNGSFKLQKNSKNEENIWVTAFVVKCLSFIKNFMTVDDKMLVQGLKFLKSKQATDGSFTETGEIIYETVQRNINFTSNAALTAYVAIAFQEAKQYKTKYPNEINLALDYIDGHLAQMKSNFEIAIASYALQLGNRESAAAYIKSLELNAVTVEEDSKFWEVFNNVNRTGLNSPMFNDPIATKVEIASYAMLAYIQAEKHSEAFPIAKWVIKNMDAKGHFKSSQSTVIALQALSRMAEMFYESPPDMTVCIKENEKWRNTTIDSSKAYTEYKFNFPSKTRRLEVSASGAGVAFFQNFYEFRKLIKNDKVTESFELSVTPKTNGSMLYVTACLKFIPYENIIESNLVKVVIELPSGYQYHEETERTLINTNVMTTQVKDDRKTIILDLKRVSAAQICPQIVAYQAHEVLEMKPANVKVFDHNHPERRANDFYAVKQTCS